jgi:Asp-tRNA(Asn)/Glu-tRNA(Gln) amidotransferase A subunit family amidase
LRLGVPEGPYLAQASADSLGWLRSVVSALKSAEGVEVVAAPCLEDIEAVAERHTDLIAAEFALEHAAWFDRYRQLYRPRTAAMVERGRTVDAEGLARARASCLVLRETLHAVLAEHRLDAFVCPSTLGEADAGLGSTGSPAMNLPWTHSGLPSLSLPVGQGGQGLPLGLQLVGRFGADEELLALGERVWGILGAA